jgi:hypothetical protein
MRARTQIPNRRLAVAYNEVKSENGLPADTDGSHLRVYETSYRHPLNGQLI